MWEGSVILGRSEETVKRMNRTSSLDKEKEQDKHTNTCTLVQSMSLAKSP